MNRHVTVPGAELHYEIRGDGPLLLVIGSPMAAAEFAPLAEALASDHTVVTYDPRGHGSSAVSGPDDDATPDQRADDIAAILDDLGLPMPTCSARAGGAVTGLALVSAACRSGAHAGGARAAAAGTAAGCRGAAPRDRRDEVDTFRTQGFGPAWHHFMVNAGFDLPSPGPDAPAPPAPPRISSSRRRTASSSTSCGPPPDLARHPGVGGGQCGRRHRRGLRPPGHLSHQRRAGGVARHQAGGLPGRPRRIPRCAGRVGGPAARAFVVALWHTRTHMFDSATALLDRMGDAARSEAMAAADRLSAIGDLYALRVAQHGEREQWAIDTDDAVAAEVAAALHTSVAMGHSNLRYARAMRERLPHVADAFRAGDIDFRLFRVIVYRTALVTDEAALEALDAQLAVRARRWVSMTSHRLAVAVDRVVAKVDRDALRRSREDIADRRFDVTPTDTGFSCLNGVVFATTGEALDRRLERTGHNGVLGGSAGRWLSAGRTRWAPLPQAPTGWSATAAAPSASRHRSAGSAAAWWCTWWPISPHSMARARTPAVVEGNELIPAEVLRELAKSAKLQPLTVPPYAAPEPAYQPSVKLADFVRARDLTCRAPGCDRSATRCDIDHTIPYSAGGRTHASNLKCLCRFHHLLKTFWGWSEKQLADGAVIWTARVGTHLRDRLRAVRCCSRRWRCRRATCPCRCRRSTPRTAA